MAESQPLLYWRGVVADPRRHAQYLKLQSPQVDAVIWKICAGQYRAASLETLSGHRDVYSVRINKEHRIVLTPVKKDGESWLQMLDIVLHHSYDKTKFLQPAVLRRYREILQTTDLIEIMSYTDTLEPSSASSSKDSFEVDFYNQSFIIFNEVQDKARQAQLPLMIMGGAGAGKTLVAHSVLDQFVAERPVDDPDFKVLYLSSREYLVNRMKANWQDSPQGHLAPEGVVEFKTWNQLLQDFALPITAENTVGKEEFLAWYANYVRVNAHKNPLPAISPDIIHEERRLLSGYSKARYPQLGERQESLVLKKDRPRVIQVDRDYEAYREVNGLIEPDLTNIPARDHYNLIVVDEAQNMSRITLRCLFLLARNARIIFCVDPHQIQNDRLSMCNYIMGMPGMNFISLTHSYRCPKNVAEVVNQLTRVKYHLTGGKGDKKEASELILPDDMVDHEGDVSLLSPTEEHTLSIREKYARDPNFAVVTDEDFRGDATRLFGTPLVFTPEEAAGLEYSHILYYRPFDHKIFKEANARLRHDPLTSRPVTGRAKKGQGDTRFSVPFQKVYTGFTRTLNQLIIVQENHHDCAEIMAPIIAKITEQNVRLLPDSSQPVESKIPDGAVSETAWIAEAKRLHAMGLHGQANAIMSSDYVSQPQASSSSCSSSGKSSRKKTTVKAMPLSAENRLKQLAELPMAELQLRLKRDKAYFDDLVRKEPPGFPLFQKLLEEVGAKPVLSGKNKQAIPAGMLMVICNMLLNFGLSTEMSPQNKLPCLHHMVNMTEGVMLFCQLLQIQSFHERISLPLWLKKAPDSLSLLMKMSAFLAPVKGSEQMGSECAALIQNPGLSLAISTEALSALQHDNVSLLELLRHVGLHVDMKYTNRLTLCHLAAQRNSTGILRYLLEKGACVNAINAQGDTPAHLAAEKANFEAFLILWQHDPSSVHIKNKAGDSPIKKAISLGHWKFMEDVTNSGIAHCLTKDEIKPLIATAVTENISVLKALHLGHIDLVPAVELVIHLGKLDMFRILRDFGVDLFAENDRGYTAAHIAAQTNNVAAIQLLHGMDFDIAKINSRGVSPLRVAIQNNHGDILEVMSSMGIDLTNSKDGHVAAVHEAARCGRSDIIKRLYIMGQDLNLLTKKGLSAAHIAANFGHVAVLKALHECGVNLGFASEEGVTPAHIAANFGHVAVLVALSECKVNLSFSNKEGITPAHVAAQYGQSESIEILKKLGVDLDVPDNNGHGVVHAAARYADANLIKSLHRLGVNLQARTPTGMTALHYSAQAGRAAVFESLISLGLDPAAENNTGFTAAHVAAYFGETEILNLLARRDMSLLDKRTPNGSTLVHTAVHAGRHQVLAMFHQLKLPDFKAKNSQGDTAAHLAVSEGHLECLKELGRINPDFLCVANSDGLTPLLVAAKLGRVEAFCELLTYELVMQTSSRSQCALVAAENNHPDILGILLKGELIPLAYMGPEILRVAMEMGHLDVVLVLAAYGVNLPSMTSVPSSFFNTNDTFVSTGDDLEKEPDCSLSS